MTVSNPRIRSLLRQANKVAASGKRAAAIELYEKILEEAPETDAAWVGLADVVQTEAEKEAAYKKALAINPENETAQIALGLLPEEESEASVAEAEAEEEEETVVSTQPMPTMMEEVEPAEAAVVEDDLVVTCYRHPDRKTGLRCYNCGKPICIDCTRKTPVGYLCPDCYKEKEDVFFNAKATDYLIAPAIAFPLSLIAGFLITLIGGGFFFIFLTFMIGGAVGSFIGRLAKRAVGNRRGRYLPHTVAAMMILGVLIPALPFLFAGALGGLLVPGIFLFVATSAAMIQMR